MYKMMLTKPRKSYIPIPCRKCSKFVNNPGNSQRESGNYRQTSYRCSTHQNGNSQVYKSPLKFYQSAKPSRIPIRKSELQTHPNQNKVNRKPQFISKNGIIKKENLKRSQSSNSLEGTNFSPVSLSKSLVTQRNCKLEKAVTPIYEQTISEEESSTYLTESSPHSTVKLSNSSTFSSTSCSKIYKNISKLSLISVDSHDTSNSQKIKPSNTILKSKENFITFDRIQPKYFGKIFHQSFNNIVNKEKASNVDLNSENVSTSSNKYTDSLNSVKNRQSELCSESNSAKEKKIEESSTFFENKSLLTPVTAPEILAINSQFNYLNESESLLTIQFSNEKLPHHEPATNQICKPETKDPDCKLPQLSILNPTLSALNRDFFTETYLFSTEKSNFLLVQNDKSINYIYEESLNSSKVYCSGTISSDSNFENATNSNITIIIPDSSKKETNFRNQVQLTSNSQFVKNSNNFFTKNNQGAYCTKSDIVISKLHTLQTNDTVQSMKKENNFNNTTQSMNNETQIQTINEAIINSNTVQNNTVETNYTSADMSDDSENDIIPSNYKLYDMNNTEDNEMKFLNNAKKYKQNRDQPSTSRTCECDCLDNPKGLKCKCGCSIEPKELKKNDEPIDEKKCQSNKEYSECLDKTIFQLLNIYPKCFELSNTPTTFIDNVQRVSGDFMTHLFGTTLDESILLAYNTLRDCLPHNFHTAFKQKSDSTLNVNGNQQTSTPKWMTSLPNILYLLKWLKKEYEKLETDVQHAQMFPETKCGICSNEVLSSRRYILDCLADLLEKKRICEIKGKNGNILRKIKSDPKMNNLHDYNNNGSSSKRKRPEMQSNDNFWREPILKNTNLSAMKVKYKCNGTVNKLNITPNRAKILETIDSEDDASNKKPIKESTETTQKRKEHMLENNGIIKQANVEDNYRKNLQNENHLSSLRKLMQDADINPDKIFNSSKYSNCSGNLKKKLKTINHLSSISNSSDSKWSNDQWILHSHCDLKSYKLSKTVKEDSQLNSSRTNSITNLSISSSHSSDIKSFRLHPDTSSLQESFEENVSKDDHLTSNSSQTKSATDQCIPSSHHSNLKSAKFYQKSEKISTEENLNKIISKKEDISGSKLLANQWILSSHNSDKKAVEENLNDVILKDEKLITSNLFESYWLPKSNNIETKLISKNFDEHCLKGKKLNVSNLSGFESSAGHWISSSNKNDLPSFQMGHRKAVKKSVSKEVRLNANFKIRNVVESLKKADNSCTNKSQRFDTKSKLLTNSIGTNYSQPNFEKVTVSLPLLESGSSGNIIPLGNICWDPVISLMTMENVENLKNPIDEMHHPIERTILSTQTLSVNTSNMATNQLMISKNLLTKPIMVSKCILTEPYTLDKSTSFEQIQRKPQDLIKMCKEQLAPKEVHKNTNNQSSIVEKILSENNEKQLKIDSCQTCEILTAINKQEMFIHCSPTKTLEETSSSLNLNDCLSIKRQKLSFNKKKCNSKLFTMSKKKYTKSWPSINAITIENKKSIIPGLVSKQNFIKNFMKKVSTRKPKHVRFDPKTVEPRSYVKRVRSGTNGKLLKLNRLMQASYSDESGNEFICDYFKQFKQNINTKLTEEDKSNDDRIVDYTKIDEGIDNLMENGKLSKSKLTNSKKSEKNALINQKIVETAVKNFKKGFPRFQAGSSQLAYIQKPRVEINNTNPKSKYERIPHYVLSGSLSNLTITTTASHRSFVIKHSSTKFGRNWSSIVQLMTQSINYIKNKFRRLPLIATNRMSKSKSNVHYGMARIFQYSQYDIVEVMKYTSKKPRILTKAPAKIVFTVTKNNKYIKTLYRKNN